MVLAYLMFASFELVDVGQEFSVSRNIFSAMIRLSSNIGIANKSQEKTAKPQMHIEFCGFGLYLFVN